MKRTINGVNMNIFKIVKSNIVFKNHKTNTVNIADARRESATHNVNFLFFVIRNTERSINRRETINIVDIDIFSYVAQLFQTLKNISITIYSLLYICTN